MVIAHGFLSPLGPKSVQHCSKTAARPVEVFNGTVWSVRSYRLLAHHPAWLTSEIELMMWRVGAFSKSPCTAELLSAELQV